MLPEQSDPFTVIGSTLLAGAVLPAPVTARTAEPRAFPDLAIIMVVAVLAVETAVAKPLPTIVATPGADEVQVTDVMFVVELSE